MLWIRSAIFLTIPDLRRENPAGTLLKTSVQSGTVAVFTIKTPLCFCLVRNCERNVCFGKAEIDRSSSRIEYTGDTGYGILVTRRNLSEKQGIRNLMLMHEMKLFEQSGVCQVKCVNFFDFIWRSKADRHIYTIKSNQMIVLRHCDTLRIRVTYHDL